MNKITLVIALLSVGSFYGQSSWKKMNSKNLASKVETVFRKSQPKKYSLYNLDIESFKNELSKQAKGVEKVIELPSYDGKLASYNVTETSNFTEPVAPEYGFIKSYTLRGINDKTETGKISVGTDGVHITIYSSHHPTFYVDPYTKNRTTYISYNRADVKNQNTNHSCLFDEGELKNRIASEKLEAQKTPDDGKLRTYRLALACTGEYATFHIAQQGVGAGTDAQKRAAVLSAMNTSMARVNGVFEKELAVRMNIVLTNGNNPLIFLNPSTDGLTNNNASTLLNESQAKCDSTLGAGNYDIGHTFSTGAGGLAGLGVVCRNGQKGKGVTGRSNPVNDPFDIDFVTHEMGHQFGAPHTFNNSCNSNRSNSNAVEPGSGSTIMAYAGICVPNVQQNSDDYFHSFSITSMWNYIQGTSCAATTNTNNAAPVANAGPNMIVPKSTPLVLRGNATDANGTNGLTYCWEQIDNEIAVMPPLSVNTGGPAFRSLPPSTSKNRYLPALATVINTGNTFSTWEVIPSVARTMNFSLVVRDNNPGGNSSDRDDMTITVANVDPFTVTSQSSAVTWNTGTKQTITWNKSTTDQAPINCQNVRIKLSTDGGLTFPHVILESTPNDGSQEILVPNTPSTNVRIMVEAVGNIFYNVNSTNFTIDASNPTFTMVNNTQQQQNACQSGSTTVSYNLTFDFVSGFSETVTLSATGLPTGATATFSPTTLNADGNATMTIGNLNGATPQDYTIVIQGQSNSVTQTAEAYLKVTGTNFSTTSLSAPSNNATNLNIAPYFSWSADATATSYDLQIATDSGFSNVVVTQNVTSNTHTLTSILNGGTTYYWRVRPKNNCGEGNYSNSFQFSTQTSSYCPSTFTDEAGGGDHITNVTFNTINNSSGNDTVDGYIDYSSISTSVNAGSSYQVSVTFNTDGFQDHCYVFIDWNGDFTFNKTNEKYDLGLGTENIATRTFNITVPNDAINGAVRMRVVVEYSDPNNGVGDGPCDTDHKTEWGETEDYSVIVNNPTASVEDFSFDNFALYPNPSNGIFNLRFEVLNTESVSIRLFDIRGRLVENIKYKNLSNTFSEELNFEKLNAGLYLMQIQNGRKQATRKIIIK